MHRISRLIGAPLLVLAFAASTPLHAAEEIRAQSAGGVPAPAPKKKHKKKRATAAEPAADVVAPSKPAPAWSVKSDASAFSGGFSGYRTRPEGGAMTEVGGEASVDYERGHFSLELPLKLRHRQTFGTPLSETYVRSVPSVSRWIGRRIKLEAGAGVQLFWRPGWLDLYQPVAGTTGAYQHSDRYSHFDWMAQAGGKARVAKRQWVEASYDLRRVDYKDDPNYDELNAPTHLVPADATRHSLTSEWRYVGSGWRFGAGLALEFKSYEKQYARDAGTGLTHAAPGGQAPNPKLSQRGIEPQVELKVEPIRDTLELAFGYGYQIVDDNWQGYDSYHAHHPIAAVSYHPIDDLTVDGKLKLSWRQYGTSGYQQTATHPALDDGTTLYYHEASMDLGGRWRVQRNLSAVLRVGWSWRKTNFPDYVPNVFPAGRAYSIDWDYSNWDVAAGIEYRFAGK